VGFTFGDSFGDALARTVLFGVALGVGFGVAFGVGLGVGNGFGAIVAAGDDSWMPLFTEVNNGCSSLASVSSLFDRLGSGGGVEAFMRFGAAALFVAATPSPAPPFIQKIVCLLELFVSRLHRINPTRTTT
jgi:hypothetical protein